MAQYCPSTEKKIDEKLETLIKRKAELRPQLKAKAGARSKAHHSPFFRAHHGQIQNTGSKCKRIVMSSLPSDVDIPQIRELLQSYIGPVEKVTLGGGCAEVTFLYEDGMKAVQKFNNNVIDDGEKIQVKAIFDRPVDHHYHPLHLMQGQKHRLRKYKFGGGQRGTNAQSAISQNKIKPMSVAQRDRAAKQMAIQRAFFNESFRMRALGGLPQGMTQGNVRPIDNAGGGMEQGIGFGAASQARRMGGWGTMPKDGWGKTNTGEGQRQYAFEVWETWVKKIEAREARSRRR